MAVHTFLPAFSLLKFVQYMTTNTNLSKAGRTYVKASQTQAHSDYEGRGNIWIVLCDFWDHCKNISCFGNYPLGRGKGGNGSKLKLILFPCAGSYSLHILFYSRVTLTQSHPLRHDSRRCAFLKQFCVYEWKKEGVNSYYLNDGKWICKAFDAYMKSVCLCNFVCSINIYYYYYHSFLRWHDFLYHKLSVVHNTFHTFRTFSSAIIACFSRDMSDSWLRAAAWWSSSSWIFRSASLSWCCASSLAVYNKEMEQHLVSTQKTWQ